MPIARVTTETQQEIAPRREAPPGLRIRRADGLLCAELTGSWNLCADLPGIDRIESELTGGAVPKRLEFDTTGLGSWDSGLVNFTLKCKDLCRRHQVEFSEDQLPAGVQKLMRLALAAPEAKDTRRSGDRPSPLARLGERGIQFGTGLKEFLEFIGAGALALLAMLRGRAQFRWSDTLLIIQRAGPEALGVVALINFLVGVILAFVGVVQLQRFGAAIFVADLVAIGTVREMGCLMTGVIVCGRTGAAFAAELGAMKANEEISAFKTFGISPIEFLVLPRILGLFLMMPLLCVFADVIAIFGGFLVSISMLDVTATEYLGRTIEAISVSNFLLGVVKSAVFGIIVAVFGCLRGMQSGEDAAGVGLATTSSVVSGITAIVAADGVFAVLCNALGV